jgi:hypothetical protein
VAGANDLLVRMQAAVRHIDILESGSNVGMSTKLTIEPS